MYILCINSVTEQHMVTKLMKLKINCNQNSFTRAWIVIEERGQRITFNPPPPPIRMRLNQR